MTPQGQALLANARDILLRVDACAARAQGWAKALNSNCRWSSIRCFPSPTWAPRVPHARSLPSVAPRVTVLPLGGPIAALLDRSHALGIIAGEHFRDPRIAVQALSSVQMVAVVGAGHALAGRVVAGQMLEPAELADHADRADRCLAVEPGPRFRRAVAADLPRQRPGHQARHDPGRPGLGPAAAGRPSATWPRAGCCDCPPAAWAGAARSPSRPIWRIASTSRWDRRHGRSGKRCRRWPEPCCLEERRHARFIRYFGDSSYPWR